MPCNCEGYGEYENAKKINEQSKAIENLTGLLNKTMQMFCYSCGLLRQHGVIGYPAIHTDGVDDRFVEFVNKHDEIDMDRTIKSTALFIEHGCSDPETLRTLFYTLAHSVHPCSEWHRTEYFNEVLKKVGIVK